MAERTTSPRPLHALPVQGSPAAGPAVDMRCSTGVEHDSHTARCQLLAGHDGPHALMFSDRSGRHVLAWRADETPVVADAGMTSRAWMRGYPVPAWFAAAEADSRLADVTPLRSVAS